jgi:hypothetical protein
MPTVQVYKVVLKCLHSLKLAQTETVHPQFSLPKRLKVALFQVGVFKAFIVFILLKFRSISTAPTSAINGITRDGHAFSSIPNWTSTSTQE